MWDLLMRHYGSQQAIADAVGVTRPNIYYHIGRNSPVPAEWCPVLSRESGIPLHVLRPDLWTKQMSEVA